MGTLIEIKQLPIFKHSLKEEGQKVRDRIASLELEKQVFTEDTVKALKKLRAELNAEKKELDTFVKEILTNAKQPISDFESEYKTEISTPYSDAETLLKDNIAIVENRVKESKKKEVVDYFNELVASEKIDFIDFEKLKIDVNLSTTVKKYKEQVNEFVTKVNDDLALIKATDYEAETMTEYKASLNVSLAITTVKTRKENEKIEAERIKTELRNNRISYLKQMGFVENEMTQSYDFDENIFISIDEINDLEKDDFTKKYLDLQAKIKAIPAPTVESEKQVVAPATAPAPVAETPKPLPAPTVEAETTSLACFKVHGTRSQLMALGQYMRDNNIKYDNVKL